MRKHVTRIQALLFSGAIGIALLFGARQAFAELPAATMTCNDPSANGTCYTLTQCQGLCMFLDYSADGAICDHRTTCCYCLF